MQLRSRARPTIRSRSARRAAVAAFTVTALAVPASAAMLTSPAQAAPAGQRHDVTSAVERARVDRVPAPELAWRDCTADWADYEIEHSVECAMALLPLDYDRPRGPKVEVALARIKAKDPAHRIGSLFLNPGGPGGSGVEIAVMAPYFLGSGVLDRFDIVGMDPRGIGRSTNVRCFPDVATQAEALSGFMVAFPYTRAEDRAAVASSKAFGAGCSTTGRPLSASMSTAEVARDLDVLRRAVGDRKLSYLGFSYGSLLGQWYANMFPDRFRALIIDGVIDARVWAGPRRTPSTPLEDRMKSSVADITALREIFRRCEQAGPERCPIAEDPAGTFDLLAERLKKKPLTIDDPDFGEITVDYATGIGYVLQVMYMPEGGDIIAELAAELLVLTDPDAAPGGSAEVRRAERALAKRLATTRLRGEVVPEDTEEPAYENGLEASTAVLCTDGNHPRNAEAWPGYARSADRRAKYFGRAWTWWTSPCAKATWTAHDEDAYRGPFDRRTAAPVLVVGNTWDPATPYWGAESVSRLLPNSLLLSNDTWGHCAYGTSACATAAMDAYLISGTLPEKGTVCHGDVQPFESPLTPEPPASTDPGQEGYLPPVVPPPVEPVEPVTE